MDAQAFWSVIGAYNEQTAALQAGLLLFAVAAVIASYSCKVKWAAKFGPWDHSLIDWRCVFCLVWNGAYSKNISRFRCTCFVALCFCMRAGTTGMTALRSQWLAAPAAGSLSALPADLLPAGKPLSANGDSISCLPCPLSAWGLPYTRGYSRKNKLLLALLTIWGLTGIKSVIFSAYEDIILLICGIYGVTLFLRETKHGMKR